MKKTIGAVVLIAWFAPGATASAQILEAVGERALGMGGAFVGVSTDSTATWWNPAALATGPFLDVTLGWEVTEVPEHLPARRDRASSFAIATPRSASATTVSASPTLMPLHRNRVHTDKRKGRQSRCARLPQASLA